MRICETLVRHGLLEREDSSRVSYRLGLTLLELGALTRQRLSIRDVAHPVLVELSAKTGDSTNLVVRRDDAAVCLIRVVGSYPVVSQALYEGGSPTTGADPASRCSRSATRSSRSPCWRDSNRTDGGAAGQAPGDPRGRLLRQPGRVPAGDRRGRGPVFGVHGDHAIAGVSVSGVVGRLADDRLPELTAAVMAAGESISRGLAYSGPYPRPA